MHDVVWIHQRCQSGSRERSDNYHLSAFNQNLEGVTFPTGLQSLTFGGAFAQNLEGVTVANDLQSWMFVGRRLEHMKGMTFPNLTLTGLFVLPPMIFENTLVQGLRA